MFGPGLTIVSVVTIIFSSWVVTSLAKHMMKGRNDDPPAPDLTTRELEVLVRKAVEEATHPLYEKIDRLERRLDDESHRLQELEPNRERDYGLIDEWPEEIAESKPKASSAPHRA